MRKALIACLSLLPLAAAHADDSISPDRPNLVDSPDAVGVGVFQLESGLAWQRDHMGDFKTWQRTTPVMLRWGAGDDWELRLSTDGAEQVRSSDNDSTTRVSGMGDSAISVKVHLHDGLAIIPQLDINSGSAGLRGPGLLPSVRMTAQWDLPHDYSLGLIGGVKLDRNDGGARFVSGMAAVSLGIPLTPQWSAFAELGGQQIASARNGGSMVTADTGVAWNISNDVQVDMALFRGLNANAPKLAWTTGLSMRF